MLVGVQLHRDNVLLQRRTCYYCRSCNAFARMVKVHVIAEGSVV